MSGEEVEGDTQWTAAARAAFLDSAEALVLALRAHADLTGGLHGRRRELAEYFDSTNQLAAAAQAFNEAEFDWCGSFPLPLVDIDTVGDEDEGDDQNDAGQDDQGQVLSVVTRRDHRIVDPDAVIEAGRASYLSSWTGDTREDAEHAVRNLGDAASEFAHAHGWQALIDCPGLEGGPDASTVVVHEGDGWWDDDSKDPFAILYS